MLKEAIIIQAADLGDPIFPSQRLFHHRLGTIHV
jgi:hypothetical protein